MNISLGRDHDDTRITENYLETLVYLKELSQGSLPNRFVVRVVRSAWRLLVCPEDAYRGHRD